MWQLSAGSWNQDEFPPRTLCDSWLLESEQRRYAFQSLLEGQRMLFLEGRVASKPHQCISTIARMLLFRSYSCDELAWARSRGLEEFAPQLGRRWGNPNEPYRWACGCANTWRRCCRQTKVSRWLGFPRLDLRGSSWRSKEKVKVSGDLFLLRTWIVWTDNTTRRASKADDTWYLRTDWLF